jgi:tetratricopeptide (TPR) repeat protein
MPDSRPEELIEAEKLIYKAKFDEALQLINEFEEKEALTPNDQLLVMLLKGRLYEYQRRPGKSVKIGEEAYQMSQKLGKVSETIDALLLKSLIVFFRSPDDALEPILEAEKLLNAHVEKPSSVLSRQKANILYRKSRIYYLKADSDHALEFALQCLALREKLGENLEISSSLLQIGFLLIIKGEYKKALDYIKRSLTLRRELNFKTGIAEILPQLALSYFNLGELDQALEICKQASSVKESNIEDKLFTLFVLVDIYSAKGELNRALKYCNQGVALAEENKIRRWLAPFQYRIGLTYALMGHPYRAKNYLVRCLTLSKEFNNFLFIVNTLGVLISISIFENSREQAQSYLKELKETVDQTGMDTDMYILSKSNLLATSGRRRDSAEAERLLRQLIDDKKTFSPVYIDALISLCSILLQELSMILLRNNTHIDG